METIKKLLLENKAWAQGQIENDPEYFKKMANEQNPEILWIGCADSRVPPNVVINTKPGSVFVHRNIANLVNENDENLMSVIEYAVVYLKVKYIIVCGHYNCGGVKAAYEGIDNHKLSSWIKSLTQLKSKHSPANYNQLVELSIIAQLENLKKLDVIKKSWESAQSPMLLGWVYDLNNGLLKELKRFDISKKDPSSI